MAMLFLVWFGICGYGERFHYQIYKCLLTLQYLHKFNICIMTDCKGILYTIEIVLVRFYRQRTDGPSFNDLKL